MIIKEISEVVDTNKTYEVYEEVEMKTPDDETVTVLQLKETVSIDQLNNEIAQIEAQIASLEARLADRQGILAEINNL